MVLGPDGPRVDLGVQQQVSLPAPVLEWVREQQTWFPGALLLQEWKGHWQPQDGENSDLSRAFRETVHEAGQAMEGQEGLHSPISLESFIHNDQEVRCEWGRPTGSGVSLKTSQVLWSKSGKENVHVHWFEPGTAALKARQWTCTREPSFRMNWPWEANLEHLKQDLNSPSEMHKILSRAVDTGALLLPDSSAASHPLWREVILRGRKEIPARDFAWLAVIARSKVISMWVRNWRKSSSPCCDSSKRWVCMPSHWSLPHGCRRVWSTWRMLS